jgi:rubrerythrin
VEHLSTPVWDAGSELQRAALARLEQHAESEAEMVGSYARMAETADDDVVRYLARLIHEDEERHHELLAEMLATLHAHVYWEDKRGSLPNPSAVPVSRAVGDEVRRLLAAEKEDASSLRRLRRDLRKMPDMAVLALILELMELDTAKHVRILEFLRASTSRRQRGSR